MKESLVKERTTFNSLLGVTYGHTQRKSANNLWGVRCYYYIFFCSGRIAMRHAIVTVPFELCV